MCFTVSIFSTTHVIEADTGALFEDPSAYQPFLHVNGFTHAHLPFIVNQHPDVIQLVAWGLIPAWTKNAEAAADIANKTLNARSETVFDKPSFKTAIRQRRGLLPIDGFVEWRHEGTIKQPYVVRSVHGGLLTLGCVWEDWTDRSTGEVYRGFSIVTTVANSLMQYVHNNKMRMPIVIEQTSRQQWLCNDDHGSIASLLQPATDGTLEAYPISRDVSRLKSNTDQPELLTPIGEIIT